MKSLSVLFLLAVTLNSSGQKKEFDTLFFLGKKYPLETGEAFNTRPYDYPFASVENHYKNQFGKSEKYYRAPDICNCESMAAFNIIGKQVDRYECPDKTNKSYSMWNFLDSVSIDLDKLDKIYIKTATNKYYIQKTKLKLVYDSLIEVIYPDISHPNEHLLSELNVMISDARAKPKFIILNDMLYSDNKKKLQLIPAQFILTLK